jgi:hypothetical protein
MNEWLRTRVVSSLPPLSPSVASACPQIKYESGDEIEAGEFENDVDTADKIDAPKLTTKRTPIQNCR